jgi:cell division protein FtsQ
MWCAIVIFTIAAVHYSRERKAAIVVKEVRIDIADSSVTNVVNHAMVARWIKEGNFEVVGKSATEIDAHAIEEHLFTHPEVRRANVWSDLNGIMTVQVTGRIPIMRVRGAGGYRFFVTDDNCIISDRGDVAAYVPVVTGVMPFPFNTLVRGSYDEMLAANYSDFLSQFTEIEHERIEVTARRAGLLADIRTERARRPKRWWNNTRDSLFRLARNARLAELREDVTHLDVSLVSLAENKAALREKEKKSQQSHHFLTKLVNFVRSIESDDFWSAQVVQINLFGGGVANGSGTWKEPQLELVPRAGNHVVLLGELDGGEFKKLNKLKTFYLDGLWNEGWSGYRYINIKYEDQVVCTK